MQKAVLLVEPRKHKLALASLMKFSTYYKRLGYRVFYVRGIQYFGLPKNINEVIVSSVFTFDLKEVVACTKYYKNHYQLQGSQVHVGGVAVSLMYNWVKEQVDDDVDIHIGLEDEIDYLPLDYNLYPDIDYSIIWTSRGCVRKCGFCAIPKIEGKLHELPNWEEQVNMNKPRIQAIDNNFTACSNEWIESVCNRLGYFDKLVDFNQSVDCRLWTEFHAEQFSKVRLECLRFSYDGKHVPEQDVRDAVKIANDYGFKDIRFDVLYNWMDTPEEFYHRLDVLTELDAKAFPMRYIPLNHLDRTYVGKHWSKEQLIAFNKVFGMGYSNGMLGNGKNSRNTFHKTFGKTSGEFIDKLNNIYVSKKGEVDKGQDTLSKWD